MPSTIISERSASVVSSCLRLTRTPRCLLLPCVDTGPGLTLNCGMVRNRSEAVIAPVMAKSCGDKLTTGTPTAVVPRISEPVISTVSGISSACATTSAA